MPVDTAWVSVVLSAVLDAIGFSESMILERRHAFRTENFIRNTIPISSLTSQLIVGSKAEGTSRFCDTDFDYVHVLKDVIVKDDMRPSPGLREQTTFIKDDKSLWTHPGYVLLRLSHFGVTSQDQHIRNFSEALVTSADKRQFLSSKFFREIHQDTIRNVDFVEPLQLTGPSSPYIHNGRAVDNVVALQCVSWPLQASGWPSRVSSSGWPSRELVCRIASQGCEVVPTGFRASPSRHLQWRLSLVHQEQELIHTFSTTQLKHYILLKLLVRDVIEPVVPGVISSYIAKTVSLWQAEKCPDQASWREETLLDHVIQSLQFMKQCVQSHYIPKYFIPDHNLLSGRLSRPMKRRLLGLLGNLLEEPSACVVLKCHQIRDYLQSLRGIGVYARPQSDEEELQQLLRRQVRSIACNNSILAQKGSTLQRIRLNHKHLSQRVCERTDDQDTLSILTNTVRQQLATSVISLALRHSERNTNFTDMYTEKLGNAIDVLRNSCNTDVLAGKMKLASAYFVLGQTQNCLDVVNQAFHMLPQSAWTLDYRGDVAWRRMPTSVMKHVECSGMNLSDFYHLFVRSEVVYSRPEIGAMPLVLRYELFRKRFSKQPWRAHDCAYVDATVLGYLLQYLCYTKQGNVDKAGIAFADLRWSAENEDSKISYREVALNILGFCYRQKGDHSAALRCFNRSLKITNELKEDWPNAVYYHLADCVRDMHS